MKNFWGYVTCGAFSAGCTGGTVYVYDKAQTEIARFKDIPYGYKPMFSPDGKLLVVKSTTGRMAVYSMESFSLLRKFRFSKVDHSQDDGFCFSPDGKHFINIERYEDSLHTAIAVYDTADFSLVRRIVPSDTMQLDHIEYDETSKTYYVLGFLRDANRYMDKGFIATFDGWDFENIVTIRRSEHYFYHFYKDLEMMGFTQKAYEWSYLDMDLEQLKALGYTLAKLHQQHHESSSYK